MGERVTAVILEADITNYENAMNRAAGSTKNLSAEGKKLAETHRAMTTIGSGMLVAGAAVAAGVGMAIAKFAEFDQAMSFVAATGDDARSNMEALRDAALDAGAKTVFSATESANAIEELAKAGLSAKDILGGGLKGSLDLAAAGGLDVADAAGIAATALKVFNLQGSDMGHVADLLAAGAGKAMGDVSDLGMALQQSGQVAAATGLTIEETTATLAAFASQGLLGSDAGTSFKTMLQRLTPQSAEAAAKMKELGFTAFDATGKFVGMEQVQKNLQASLKGLTDEQRNSALATIFGADAVRGANVLYNDGIVSIGRWTDAVNDQGFAADTAKERIDNLMGDWEQFTGALDTAFISMGEGANGPLRDLIQGLTGLVDGFNDLPEGGKQAVLWVGLVTAGVGLLGGGALVAIPKLAALKIALDTLSITGASTRAGLLRFASFLTGPWGIAIVAATTAVMALTSMQDKLRTSTEAFQNVIKNAKGVDELFNAADSALPVFSQLEEATKDAKTFKENLDIIAHNDFLRGLRGETSQLSASLTTIGEELSKTAQEDAPAAAKSFKMLADQMQLSKHEQIDLLNAMKPYRDELVKLANAQDVDVTTKGDQIDMNALLRFALDGATTATGSASRATQDLEAAAAEAVGTLDDMKRALDDVAGTAISMAEAHDSALSAINGLVDAAAAEGVTLDGTNDASIRFRDSVREVEQAHRDSAAAILENGGTLAAAQSEWQAGREKVIEMRVAMGESREEAINWANQNLGSAEQVVGAMADVSTAVNAVPDNKNINITLSGSAVAISQIQAINAQLDSLPQYKGITVGVNGGVSGLETGGLLTYKQFANGGMNSGIYPGGAEIHKFAERTLPWEAYISPKSDQRQQNYGTWMEVGNRLGFMQSQPASTNSAPIYNLTGDIYGQDPEEIAREVNKQISRGVRTAGIRKTVGD
ncbi:Phage-related minor tail protein [Microbacterium hydrocarbonoxydans]|uniref:Phage-related minor tail protein n=1 Tax=Microbacterium hydrocarbonoxydans TaxID=273678 RepID=A0A0M2HHR3_9MICO|nr:phage tail tape measure protein [Microbacterium hydrocarbonoxydans]KJL46245.1 Phage-related minor tail protein [Microbacterium hydrocarbonoxydans]